MAVPLVYCSTANIAKALEVNSSKLTFHRVHLLNHMGAYIKVSVFCKLINDL